MIHKKTKFSKSAVLLGTAMLFTVSPAWAGFEWTPPPAPEKVMMVPAGEEPSSPQAAPAPMVESRAIKDRGNMASMSSPERAAPANQISKMPASMMEEPVVATVSPVSGAAIPAQDAAADYEDVQGFGTDIPLATAMSQIVPANFAYSVDSPAMLGQKVSWTGGMAWNKVLEKAVEPLGLEVAVIDDTVWIREEGRAPSAKTVKAPQPQPAKASQMSAAPEPMQAMEASSTMMPRPPVADENTAPQHVIAERRTTQSPFGNMKPVEDDQASSSYQRRNPIPMMMKADASDAPEPMAAAASAQEADPVATAQPPQNIARSGDADHRNYQHVVTPRSYEQSADAQSVNARLDPFEIKYWTAEKGESLRNVLTNWGLSAGTEIRWTSPYDYRLPSALKTHATFPDAVTKVLTFYEDLEPRPVGRLHPNLPNGPSVLVIENYGTMVN